MKYLLLLLLFVVASVSAGVYKTVDEDGNVTFTDEPSVDAEKIKVEDNYNIIPAPTAAAPEQVAEETEATEYKISVASPNQDETLRANSGSVMIQVQMSPSLDTKEGHLLRYQFDGKQLGSLQSDLSYSLTNVDRGSHIIVVSVVDKHGKVLKRSKSRLFHLQRHAGGR